MTDSKSKDSAEETAKRPDGDRMPPQVEKKAAEAINPSSPGDTGTTPGTNADNG